MEEKQPLQTSHLEIPIDKIQIGENNPRKTFNKDDMKELAESIKQHGVIQAIGIRPLNGESYELIYGERRLKASVIAGKTTIPARVFTDIEDASAEAIQFIENMDRVDVHPIEQAEKFLAMLNRETGKYTAEDIAVLIGKPNAYILQVLELNKLIKPLKQDYRKDMFGYKMALNFARLSQEDQKQARGQLYSSDSKRYGSLGSLMDFIERRVIRDLNSAPFDKTDPLLNPKMGPCTTCPYRSGANVLFADIKDKDICFKKDCFEIKMVNYVLQLIDHVAVAHPGIKFMYSGYDEVHPDIQKKIEKELGQDLSSSYNSGYTTYKQAGYEAQKFLMVSGREIGKIDTYYKAGTKSTKKADIKEMVKSNKKKEDIIDAIKLNIQGIKDRQARFLELDAEKVWTRVEKDVIEKSTAMINAGKLSAIEWGALAYALYDKTSGGGYGSTKESPKEQIAKILMPGKDDYKRPMEDRATVLAAITFEQFYEVARIFMRQTLNTSNGSHMRDLGKAMMIRVANEYHNEQIVAITTEQNAVADKRIANADKKIKQLEAEKKDMESKIKMNGKDKKLTGKQAMDDLKKELKEVKGKKKAASKSKKSKLKDEDEVEEYLNQQAIVNGKKESITDDPNEDMEDDEYTEEEVDDIYDDQIDEDKSIL